MSEMNHRATYIESFVDGTPSVRCSCGWAKVGGSVGALSEAFDLHVIGKRSYDKLEKFHEDVYKFAEELQRPTGVELLPFLRSQIPTWIDIKDELPPANTPVLVWRTLASNEYLDLSIFTVNHPQDPRVKDQVDAYGIMHWMPSPLGPKKKEGK